MPISCIITNSYLLAQPERNVFCEILINRQVFHCMKKDYLCYLACIASACDGHFHSGRLQCGQKELSGQCNGAYVACTIMVQATLTLNTVLGSALDTSRTMYVQRKTIRSR